MRSLGQNMPSRCAPTDLRLAAMKAKYARSPIRIEPVSDDDIRDYAYHLYLLSGCVPGRDLDNWLEAKACLSARIPKAETHTRLHRQTERVGRQAGTS